MLHTKFSENRPAGSGEEDFWVFFTRAGYHEKKCTAVYHSFQSSTVVCIAVYRKLYIETIWAFWCSTLNVWPPVN